MTQRNGTAKWSEGLGQTLARGLEAMAPASTVVVSALIGGPCPLLYPEEKPAVADAVPSRVHEFATGRACARVALGRLGVEPCAVPVGADRRPVFPSGVTGSITHSGPVCIVAAAPDGLVASVGVDVEVAAVLPDPIVHMVCLPVEREAAVARCLGPSWAVLHFSAKEAIYKARQGVAPGWLGFKEVKLSFTSDGRAFAATVARPGRHSRFLGCSLVIDGVVATLAWPVPS